MILLFLPSATRATTVGYWRFETGSELADSSGNDLSLTAPKGGPVIEDVELSGFPKVIPRKGAANTSFARGTGVNNVWKGNSCSAPIPAALSVTNSMSIEVFANLPPAVTTPLPHVIVGYGANTEAAADSGQRGWVLVVTPEDSSRGPRRLLFQYQRSEGAWGAANLVTIDSGIELTGGNDYYLAATVDFTSGNIDFYCQDFTAGTPLQASSLSLPTQESFNQADSSFTIGSDSDSGNKYWYGSLDEVRLSNTKLLANELLVSNDSQKSTNITPSQAAALAPRSPASVQGDALPKAEALLQQATVGEGDQARLRRLFNKASIGGKIVVGVLGGSITEGAASTDSNKRYSGIVLNWWKRNFPKAEFVLVNAGIGATGSGYGALRADRDLLSKKPDFVILEYAVNDKNTKEEAESYEGVVRQILKAPNDPALILLFMMRQNGTNAQEWESKVGAHYNLPMLSYRDALWPLIQKGSLQWKQLSPDVVHPNDNGHGFVGQLISVYLDKALESYMTNSAEPELQAMTPPLFSSLYEACTLSEGEGLKPVANQGWVLSQEKKNAVGWKSSTPGSVIEFEVEGETVLLSFWRIQGPMGVATASIDGAPPIKMDAWFDQTWGGYRRWEVIARGLKPGKHKVKVELLPEKNDQSTGHEFVILGLGSAGADANRGQ